MIRMRWAALLPLLLLSGCVRREGRNADCQWPRAEKGTVRGDLLADLELAEELAIRYMDAHQGPRDQQATAQAKNSCLGVLLEQLSKEHGMTAQQAFPHFGYRRTAADVAIALPLLVLLALGADAAVRRLLLRYPLRDGWLPAIVMLSLAALAFGGVSLLLGQQWATLAESVRIGTTHLSIRGSRLPIHRYPLLAFATAMVLFLAAAVRRYRTSHRAEAAG
ncbi:MAG: hypothetical protein FJW31_30595 [Acidobacteria bacterium]|nr:hypothetical protein [Acidobacteriota bacterium]